MATLLLLVAIVNLVVVATNPVDVTPSEHLSLQLSIGRDADGPPDGRRIEWAFSVEPGALRVVDLDIIVPYSARVSHYEGDSQFSSLFNVYLDGQRIASTTYHTKAPPERAGETWTERTDLGDRLGRLVIERAPDNGPFVLLVTLDWSHSQTSPDSTRFDIEIGPVQTTPTQLEGLPGCSSLDCARILFIVGVIAQGGSMVWTFTRWHKDPATWDKNPDKRLGPRSSKAPSDLPLAGEKGVPVTDKEK